MKHKSFESPVNVPTLRRRIVWILVMQHGFATHDRREAKRNVTLYPTSPSAAVACVESYARLTLAAAIFRSLMRSPDTSAIAHQIIADARLFYRQNAEMF